MGVNEWHRLDHWPPKEIAWYLRRDGALSLEPPPTDEPADIFRHAPADPVPAHGGADTAGRRRRPIHHQPRPPYDTAIAFLDHPHTGLPEPSVSR
ncbi:hypothetical protein [Actinacidiphila oryziradicis]|uniref:Uncharacterized protein n=1 Tax=Actinacidiphila oryziradicis TaxID=2571141 RepID=A0A4U0RJW4_9ACTN|nr:hypothetical protein [Actinacidiphila oryziradicis]TJZ95496.1 hypothetical protein FCI23_52085 [Actinacidiphila oryziradicis]